MNGNLDEQHEERASLTLPDVVRSVFTGPSGFVAFAEAHLTTANPPAFLLVAWLLGMDGVAGALELEYITTGAHLVDNWFHAWLRVIFGGIAAGVVRYWLIGSVFHGIVLASGGRGPARTSRYLFLYAALPVVVVELGVKVAQMLAYGNGYFAGLTNPTFDGVAGGAMMGAFGYTAVLCYAGMRRIQGTGRTRSLAVMGAVAAVMVWLALVLFLKGGA